MWRLRYGDGLDHDRSGASRTRWRRNRPIRAWHRTAIPVGFVPGDVARGFISLAAATPLPVNSPGLVVAAIDGRPRFSEASRALLALAIL